jgi:hypothetical protein
MLAFAEIGRPAEEWEGAVHQALAGISLARRKELIRILKVGFVEFDAANQITCSPFLDTYHRAPATTQVNLLALNWALSHPLTLIASTALVSPALTKTDTNIPLSDVEKLVGSFVKTRSIESLRKTRTVLLGALEGIGVIATKGTGKHRSLRATRGIPDPISFSYLLLIDLQQRQERSMMTKEAFESSLPCRLTQCTTAHARWCLSEALERGLLSHRGDEVGHP